MQFSKELYLTAIQRLNEGLLQLELDGESCSICGDTGHQAFDCELNPLVALRLMSAYHCWFCGKWFEGEAAEEHFHGLDCTG